MTKAEMIAALKDMPDDAKVGITLESDVNTHLVTKVKFVEKSNAIWIISDEVPELDSIFSMAEVAYEENDLSTNDKERLEKFLW